MNGPEFGMSEDLQKALKYGLMKYHPYCSDKFYSLMEEARRVNPLNSMSEEEREAFNTTDIGYKGVYDEEGKTQIVYLDLPLSDLEKNVNEQDMFDTPEEAEARAQELGGSGYHVHANDDGSVFYMPFSSMEAYAAAREMVEYEYEDHDDEYYKVHHYEEKEVSAQVEAALEKKVKEHNDKVGDVTSKRTNLRALKAVFKRGVGAYKTNPGSVRPHIRSADEWAYARVKSFLYVLRNGRFRSGKHDTDLLPDSHPKSSKNMEEKAVYQGQDVPLGKPSKGDVKKFKVYVRNPSTGKIVKVNFGLSVDRDALEDPDRRKAFADRHGCEQANDKTSPKYWACRTPNFYHRIFGGSKISARWW
jgi:hypothetical protein